MAIDRGTVVAGIAVLDLEAIGEEGIATGGVDDEARRPFDFATVVVAGTNDGLVIAREVDSPGLAAFMDFDALLCGIADEDGVEFRPLHLVGVGHRLVPGIREMEGLRHGVLRGDEFGPPFLHPDRPDVAGYAQPLEKWQVGRQQRLADVKTRMARLLQENDSIALFDQQGRHR